MISPGIKKEKKGVEKRCSVINPRRNIVSAKVNIQGKGAVFPQDFLHNVERENALVEGLRGHRGFVQLQNNSVAEIRIQIILLRRLQVPLTLPEFGRTFSFESTM